MISHWDLEVIVGYSLVPYLNVTSIGQLAKVADKQGSSCVVHNIELIVHV